MTESAFGASAGTLLDSYDFNQNYRYLKKLLKELKAQNIETVQREIFGEDERGRPLTKKEMKQLFQFLRKIENHYDECRNPPIPEELEKSIRSRDNSKWLPWEKEAIEKVDAWREELKDRKQNARAMLNDALAKLRAKGKAT